MQIGEELTDLELCKVRRLVINFDVTVHQLVKKDSQGIVWLFLSCMCVCVCTCDKLCTSFRVTPLPPHHEPPSIPCFLCFENRYFGFIHRNLYSYQPHTIPLPRPPIFHLPMGHLPSLISHLSSLISHLSFLITSLPSPLSHLLSPIFYLPPTSHLFLQVYFHFFGMSCDVYM